MLVIASLCLFSGRSEPRADLIVRRKTRPESCRLQDKYYGTPRARPGSAELCESTLCSCTSLLLTGWYSKEGRGEPVKGGTEGQEGVVA